MLTLGFAMARVRGHAAAPGGGVGVERPAVDAILRARSESRLSSPCGTAPRAGLAGRRPRGTCSILRCSRVRFRYWEGLSQAAPVVESGAVPPTGVSLSVGRGTD